MPATRTLNSVLAAQKKAPPDRSIFARWKHPELFKKGFVAIPSLFLRLYAHLKPFPLTSGEALFILHLMEFKWDDAAPFPGYKTIAYRMGVTDKMVRRHAQSLETKKYLRRERRVGQTNRFDLNPLFDALARAAEEQAKLQAKRRKKAQPVPSSETALLMWLTGLVDAYKTMPEGDKKKLAKWEARNPGIPSSDWPGWELYLGPKP